MPKTMIEKPKNRITKEDLAKQAEKSNDADVKREGDRLKNELKRNPSKKLTP